MNKTVRIALAVISILVAIAVALWVVMSIDSAGKAGRNLAETEFDRFTNTLRGVKSLDELNDPFLRERLVALYKGSRPLLATMIMDQQGQIVWGIPADTPYLSEDRTTLAGPKSSTTSYSSQISGNINLVALYTTLPQTKVYSILRNAIILLGVYVVAVILVILVISILKPREKTAQSSYEQPTARPGPPTLRTDKPRTAPASSHPSRVQGVPGSLAATGSASLRATPTVGDLASSRLAPAVPMQTSQAGVAAMAGKNPSVPVPQKPDLPSPGLHDIEFPELDDSSDSKFRMSPESQIRPERTSADLPPTIPRDMDPGTVMQSERESRTVSSRETAKALAEFEASYRGLAGKDETVKGGAVKGESRPANPPGELAQESAWSQSRNFMQGVTPGNSELSAGKIRQAGIETQPRQAEIPFSARASFASGTPGTVGDSGEMASSDGLPQNEEAGTEFPSEYTLGLYSPISGLGWERNLPERLETEISRSQADGGDVALLMVSLDGLMPRDPMYPSFTSSLKDYFGIRDLAFECGQGGFALILPNIDVKRAVRLSEDLLKNLKQVISLYREPTSRIPLYMGISAVAGRAVPAGRIVREAAAALQKARTDHDSHIVAFNPDPARYRKRTEKT